MIAKNKENKIFFGLDFGYSSHNNMICVVNASTRAKDKFVLVEVSGPYLSGEQFTNKLCSQIK